MTAFRLGTQNRRQAFYDHFSAGEMDRRWAAVREMMHGAGFDALVVYGNGGPEGTNVRYLTDYTPSFVTYLVVFADPDEPSLLLAGRPNHHQYVREVALVDEVDTLLPDPPSKVVRRIEGTDAADGRIGVVGHAPRYDLSIPYRQYAALEGGLDAKLVDATVPFGAVLAKKSEEELELVRRAAELTDLGMETIADTAVPGVTERELHGAIVDRIRDAGGSLGMAFLTSAPMEGAEPGEPLPWHKPSNRPIEDGDVITTEMSASYRGYRSQVHRTFTVGRPPNEAYEALWEVAAETYESLLSALRPGTTAAEVHEAMAPIEESPYQIYDVVVHAYGNGYLPPFLGTETSDYWPGIDDPVSGSWTFEAGMVVVVQPNLVTEEERHGLQLGSAVVVSDGSPEVLQEYPLEIAEL